MVCVQAFLGARRGSAFPLPSAARDLQQLRWWLLGFGDTTDVTALVSSLIPRKRHLLVRVFVGIWTE